MPERLLTRAQVGYDILFDIVDYQNLYHSKSRLSPGEFDRQKCQLDTLKRHNLKSALGERFNAEVFCVTYYFASGQLFNADHDEPFLEVIQRGQKHRQQAGSAEIVREKAEAAGFAAMSRILLDSQGESLSERKVIIISPRGNKNSIYQHNFFDVYQKNHDDTITMSRFTCKFNYCQFRQAAANIDPFANLPPNPTDADFLATPLLTYKSLTEICKILSPQEETLPLNQYQQLLEICTPLITSYLQALAAENVDPGKINKLYAAILNVADDFILKPAMRQQLTELIHQSLPLLVPAIEYYSRLPVRPVAAGCGIQTGFRSNVNGQLSIVMTHWSVAEFGLGNRSLTAEKTLNCRCPFCSRQVNAVITSGRIICPSCGQSAPYEC